MKHPHNTKSSLEAVLARLVVAKMDGRELYYYKPIFSYIQKRHKPVYHRFVIWLFTLYMDELNGRLVEPEKHQDVMLIINAHMKCVSGIQVKSKEFASVRKKCRGAASISSLYDISASLIYFLNQDTQISKLSDIIQEQLHRGNEYR